MEKNHCFSLVKENKGIITGELNVLLDPVFEEAFESILELYKPKYEIAIFSLCTHTKPFSSSMKWKGIIRIFGEIADLIVCSNAGIIPLEFENYYPYICYDSHGGQGSDELSDYSKDLFTGRLKKFFEKFQWKKVVFLLNPYEGASECVYRLNKENIKQFPSSFVYDSIKEHTDSEFIGYSLRYYKILSRSCIEEVQNFLEIEIPILKENFTRSCSLIEVISRVYEKMEESKPYTKKDLVTLIQEYGGDYDKSYIFKIINGNVKGVLNYKYCLKNNEYFILNEGLYYKNIGQQISSKQKKLF